MKFNSFLLLVSSTAIPMVVAGTLADRRAASVNPELERVERAVDDALPRAGDGDVHEMLSHLDEAGFGDLLPRDDTDISKRADVGLAPSQWVNVPGSCVTCMLTCLAGIYGTYNGGQNVADIGTWRQIGSCGVSCYFSGQCSTAQAGTWQAQQPHTFSTHSKRED
ncbi:hypothetical protein BJ170DRAFT_678323 [Xylariales sp. AK1849]|nr:hypothetical protein BJ170DRAFT_678323 [Xylariales sp. AK1849]